MKKTHRFFGPLLLLHFSCIAFAQTGPGGVGNTTSNNMWYSGDGGAYTNAAGTTQATVGQQVYVWADLSGNGRNATQATAANRPLYHRNTTMANGMPGLRFTGNLFIDGPSPGIANNSSYTYFVVFRDTSSVSGATTDGAGTFILDRTTATNNLVSLKPVVVSGNNFYFYQKRNNAGTGLGGVTSTTNINTNMKVVAMRRDYNSNYQMFYNNQQQGGNIPDADGATTPPNPRIGRHATTNNGGLRGYMYEFIVYNLALNPAQRIIVNNYLAAKYDFALLADDLYTMDDPANGNYDFEVAGIGRWNGAGNSHTDARGTSIVRMNSASNLDNNEYLIWGHDNGTMTTNNTVDVDGAVIQSRLNRVWRLSEAGGDVGTVTISFDVTGFTTVTGSDLRLLIDRDGDGFADNDVAPLAGSFAGNIVTFTGVDFQDGDRFTLGSINAVQTPLPVELLDFQVQRVGQNVRLFWETASEHNSSHFEIQRSSDGTSWGAIGQVSAAGFSAIHRNYNFIDHSPLAGLSYYRLRKVDLDGTWDYSVIRTVDDHSEDEEKELHVFPNPTDGIFQIIVPAGNSIDDVRIIDTQGRLVRAISLSPGLQTTVSTDDLSCGMYFLMYRQSGKINTISFVKY